LNVDELDESGPVMKLLDLSHQVDEIICTELHPFQEWKPDEIKMGIDGTPVKLSEKHVFHLQNYFFITSLKNTYLSSKRFILVPLVSALVKTNVYWQQYKVENIQPPLACQFPSLLPSINSNNYDERDIDEWVASLDSVEDNSRNNQLQRTTRGQKTKKKNGHQKKQASGEKIEKVDLVSTEKPKASPTSSSSIALDSVKPKPIELLRNQLVSFYQLKPSRALRQAIWHLDSLISIQKSLVKSQKKALDCLTVANAVTYSAQKVLEQSYRFCLKKEGEPLSEIHNLKTYHRMFDPNYKKYPKVVKDLFLANTWCRYFYTEHKKWHSFTTGIAKVPPILDKFFEMAEDQHLTALQLEEFVSSTMENVHQHLEYLLQEKKLPNSELSIFCNNEAMALENPLPLTVFDSVGKKLKDLLVVSKLNSRHPVYLRIKQVLAALKMQKVSLEKMNASKDIYAFSTWAVWCLQQLQESTEGVLHSIEYLQNHGMSVEHELKILAKKVNLDMGALGDAYQSLSYKVRYPAEVLVNTVPARIIDDLEALKQHPEIMQGFEIQDNPITIWARPSREASPNTIVAKLNPLMIKSEEFLRIQAVPALERLLSSL
jgi:hypothetical protein